MQSKRRRKREENKMKFNGQFLFCLYDICRRKRYSPEKTDGEREMEDLRSRLLSKRSKQDIERKIEEHQMYHRK